MAGQEPGVHIRLSEIYSAVLSTQAAVNGLATDINAIKRQLDHHDRRIEALEARRWPIAMVGSLVGVIGLAITVGTVIMSGIAH